ncbi:MAG TPA: DUF6159 family protein [Kofleriaceae bacterium]|nr:DUF6159 family protein [Kofleriaceae bacterium]
MNVRMNGMNVIDAIVELTKASWRVLRRHPSLAWFPILSLAVVMTFLIAISPILDPGDGDGGEVSMLVIFGITLCMHAIQVFFTASLTTEALKALRGETPGIACGIGAALERAPAIVGLSLVTGTVGFGLSLLGRCRWTAVRVARSLVGTAWSLATYLAIPVMVQERRGAVPSLKRSGDLFRRTWGETTLSEVGVRVVTVHLTLILVLLAVAIVRIFGDSPLVLLVLLAMFAAFIGVIGALEAIYRAALYVFASEGVVPAPFGGPELDAIWQVKPTPSDDEPPPSA